MRRDPRSGRRGRETATAGFLLTVGLIGWTFVACDRAAPGSPEVKFASIERTLTLVAEDALWTVGGDPADTLLLLPMELVVSEDVVFVLDTYGHRVSGFDGASGRHLWSRGGRGTGPADLNAPRLMQLAFGGGVDVADGGNARIARFGPSGETAAPIPVRGTPQVHGLCATGEGEWLLATMIPGERLLRYAPARDTIIPIGLPGPYAESEPAIATQAQLAGDGRGGCALTFSLGAGFALFEEGGFGPFRPYVEPLDLPDADVRTTEERTRERILDIQAGALDAKFVGDEVWILFGGATEYAGRLLDRYDRSTGNYEGSLVLPSAAQKFAVDTVRVYALVRRAGYPVLVAWPRVPPTEP